MLLSIFFALSISHAEDDLEDIRIFVQGMVCSFCVQGVEKQFKGQDSVEKVDVDLADSVVSVWLKAEQTLTDADIKNIIKDSGYDVESIERIDSEIQPTDQPPQAPLPTKENPPKKENKMK